MAYNYLELVLQSMNILLALVVSLGYLMGYVLYKLTKEELDPFLKKYKHLQMFAHKLDIRAGIVGAILGFFINYIFLWDLEIIFGIFFGLYIIQGSIFSSINKKPAKKPALIFFASFVIFYLLGFLIRF